MKSYDSFSITLKQAKKIILNIEYIKFTLNIYFLVPCGFLFKKKKLTQSSRENSRDLPFSQIAIMGMLCFSRGSRFMKMY